MRGDKDELAVEQDGSEIVIDNEGSQEKMVQKLARVEDEFQRSIHRMQIKPENINFRTVPDS